MHTFRRLAAVAVGVACLAGCNTGADADHLTTAKASLAKGDLKDAVIHLKTVLQGNPDSGEARWMLGTALLRVGDAAGALVELSRARDLKFSEDLVVPSLAKAWMGAGQCKKVIESLGAMTLTDPLAASDLQASLAACHSAAGNTAGASAAVDNALLLNPKNAKANLVKARLLAGRDASDEAQTLVARVLADDPNSHEALNLQGELLWLKKNDLDGAVSAFRQALKLAPDFMPAHSSLMALLLERKDVEGFKAAVQALKKALPNRAETQFYEAQSAYLDRDFARAREAVQKLLLVTPDNPYVLQLAGAIELQMGAVSVAEARLIRALTVNPKLPLARRLLGEAQVRGGQPARALGTLQSLLDQPSPGADVLGLVAEAHLQAGDPARAEKYFTLAAKADPEDPKARMSLAVTQIARGNADAGFAQLEAFAAKDIANYADLALISARMQRGETDAALRAVDRLGEKMKASPLPHLLKAKVLLARSDTSGARASFEQALAVDAAYVPALVGVATLDLAAGKPQVALARFESLLARDPKNLLALLAVAELKQRTNAKPEDIGKTLADAVRLHPTEPSPRLAQIDFLLSQRQSKDAIAAAQVAVAALPNDTQLLDGLGRAQLAAGETEQAVNTLRKVSAAQPLLAGPYLRLAHAMGAAKNPRGAEQSFRKALEVSPKLLDAQRGLIGLALSEKRSADALKVAAAVQKERPAEAVGYLLEGEIQARMRDWDAAAAAFRTALQRERTSTNALRLMSLYEAAARPADAQRTEAEWLKANPRDADFIFQLGTLALAKRDLAGAEQRFRKVHEMQPDNPSAPNNIAWLLLQQSKPGALPFAEKANQLLPDIPALIDTYAVALAADKQWAEAAKQAAKAVQAAPDVPAYRLGLAKYLIAAGNGAAAKPHLEALVALGAQYSGQTEAAALLKGL